MTPEFVHLHVHSEYSLGDGIIRIDKLVQRAKELGMPSVALTDHGVMYGAIELVEKCRKSGVKPIIGCEMYVAESMLSKEGTKDSSYHHLVLLAKDDAGYRNLLKMVSASYRDGFYYKPRIDKAFLAKHSDGLIALTACLSGEIPSLLLQGKRDEAVQSAGWYLRTFGQENFFLELQDHGLSEEKRVIPHLIKFGDALGIGLVATNDAHYLDIEDERFQEVMVCIKRQEKLSDPNRQSPGGLGMHFKTVEEMAHLFGERPDSLSNTLKIAEMIDFEPKFGVFDFPKIPLPDGLSENEYLAKLAWSGLEARFKGKGLTSEYRQRLEYELGIIADMGFAPIFLIVEDCVKFAKDNLIPVGPGRGSAVSGLVSWALRITEADPVEYDLMFERFLNPGRKSLPDIDIDFCPQRRAEILAYIQGKYGIDHISQIITFNRLKARNAIRDTARVLDIQLSEADRIAKLVPFNATLQDAIERVPELGSEYDDSPRLREWFEYAMAVEGLARNVSVHAAGLVISGSPAYERLPLQTMESTEHLVSQYSMEYIDKLGLIKIDVLGLRTLTYLEHTCRLLKERYDIDIDLNNLPLDDTKTYEMLSKGDTIGVFQLESTGIRELIRDIRPDTVHDLMACIALYRPGPMRSGYHNMYARRKNKIEPVIYDHPLVKSALEPTYGALTYQEQVGLILQQMGGFTLPDAVLMVKAISKKKAYEIDEYEEPFINGAKNNGVDEALAKRIYQTVKEFSGYGFNKAHATAYGLIAYQTAYLKANYPIEFYAAYLSSEMHDSEKISAIISEIGFKGYDVIQPDINHSGFHFTIEDGKIRFALGAIKNVGQGAIEMIETARKTEGVFKSLFDFTARVGSAAQNKGVIESLIFAGAMDTLDGTRGEKLASVERSMEYGKAKQEDALKGQTSLFGGDSIDAAAEPALIKIGTEIPKKQLLKKEKEMIGLYLSENPLKEVADKLRVIAKTSIAQIDEKYEGKKVVIAGILSSMSRRISKKLQSWAVIELEDLTGRIEAMVFPSTYEECKEYLIEDTIVIIEGRVQAEERDAVSQDDDSGAQVQLKLFVSKLTPYDNAMTNRPVATQDPTTEPLAKTIDVSDDAMKAQRKSAFRPRRGEVLVHVNLDEADSDGLANILEFLDKSKGDTRVRLAIKRGAARASVDLGDDCSIAMGPEILDELNSMLGVGGIQVG